MRLLDHDEPIDPEIADTLDAIDAVIAGEPVHARYAELAEIALLLSSERTAVPQEFARSMDARVARRFAPAPEKVRRRRRWPSAGFWEATGALTAGVAVIAAVVVVAGRARRLFSVVVLVGGGIERGNFRRGNFRRGNIARGRFERVVCAACAGGHDATA